MWVFKFLSKLIIEFLLFFQENYESFDGFVILHGTDTMSYSASALSFMLENLTKPVVITGSQVIAIIFSLSLYHKIFI